MTARASGFNGSFCGFPVASYSLSVERDAYEVYSVGEYLPARRLGPVGATLSLAVYGAFDWYDLFDSSMYTLGGGRVCAHCGDYNPAGLANCHRCGAPTEWRPDVSLEKMPFMATRCQVSSERDDFLFSEFDFIADGAVTMDSVSKMIGYDIAAKQPVDPQFLWGRTDYYLCPYCGQAVPEGKVCPSCQGVRHPWSEILKMDRECVYCGTKVVGGIVCPGCGRRLSGKTVSNAVRRVWA